MRAILTYASKVRGAAIAATVYALLTLVVMAPVLLDPGGLVLGWPGDQFEYVWKHWWAAKAVTTGVSPFFNPDVYVPFGFDLAHGELTPVNTFLLLPLTLLLGPVWTYNVSLFASFVLSGVGTYLLVRRFTSDHAAALLGGAAFAFCSFRMAHLPGHYPIMSTGWEPFAFLWLDRAVAERTARAGAIAGLFYALTALGSWYLGYGAGLAGLLYLAVRGWPWRVRKGDLRPALAFALVAGLLITPFALPYVRLAGAGRLRQLLEVANNWSASIGNFLVPNPLQPFWGWLIPAQFQTEFVERLLYLGVVPVALAIVALRCRRDPVADAFAFVAAVFLILALGTTLRWSGEPVYVQVGSATADRFYAVMSYLSEHASLYRGPYEQPPPGTVNVPMPGLVPYLWLPLFSSMRTPGRMAVHAMLAISVLAAFGFSRLGWRGRARALAAAGLVGFAFLDTLIWYEASPARPRAVDLWLAGAERHAVAEFPLAEGMSGPGLFRSMYHGKPIIHGYGTHIPAAFRATMPTLLSFPAPAALDLLRRNGVGWVVVTPRAYEGSWPAVAGQIEAAKGLRPATDLEGVRVYALDPG
jgi:hypothetical protein